MKSSCWSKPIILEQIASPGRELHPRVVFPHKAIPDQESSWSTIVGGEVPGLTALPKPLKVSCEGILLPP